VSRSICLSSTRPSAPTAAGCCSLPPARIPDLWGLSRVRDWRSTPGLRDTRAVTWDPDQYLRFGVERALPFRHLTAAIDHLQPAAVVDLGCGPGGLTATLLERWPEARITGIDTSRVMVDHARRREVPGRLTFEIGDALTWRAPHPVDLILSNACFHWIDDHLALLDHLLPQLAAAGTLAFQVPANHDAPSHTLLRDLCASARWRDQLEGLPRTGVRDPGWYVEKLGRRGLRTIVWETTYHHLLEGPDPVLEWVKGTTLRPILERLDTDEQLEFTTAYGSVLRRAYPENDGTTLFPFKRLFVVTTSEHS
jgi:trans-aconitate 2-methyltransferase